MSSRVLRKLHGDNDLTTGLGGPEGSDPENNEEDLLASAAGGGAKRKQFNVNRYDLLNEQSLSESEVKEDDDNETEPTQKQEGGLDNKNSTKRKKKKKKKKAVKPSSNQRSSEDMEGDEIDEVNRMFGVPLPIAPSVQNVQERTKSLLSIEHRNLNPNNELKRIFGVKIVQSEQRKRTRTRSHLRVTGLVTPKETWPHVGKQGITMRYVEQVGTVQTFTYEHSASYQGVQRMFLGAVESLNPDNVVAIIHVYPYHIDALIQLSELCRMSEDLPMAADLVERALYALECAFHPLFSLAQGNCRLDYCKQENRALFITLFKHLSYVGQRACHRTALELCKVLLSLNPDEDPLAMILVIDVYSLRSRQFAWLLRLASEWESTRNLSQLPNFAYSTAVAMFHLAQQGTGEMAHADEALQKALIMFPGVLTRLLEKCAVQTDAKVAANHFFGPKSQTSMSPALAQLVALYVARAWPAWKEAELLPWLERNTHAVVARVDARDPLVAECEGHRRRRYQGTPPHNITRHVLLADLKDVPSAIVGDDSSQTPVMSFDPLPPAGSVNLYDRPERPRVTTTTNVGALSMFFRSILPHFNPNDMRPPPPGVDVVPRVNVEADDDEDGAAGGPEVRRSLASLMEVLRDLLRNIQMADSHDRGDADVDSSGNDDVAQDNT